jgi:Fic family protein
MDDLVAFMNRTDLPPVVQAAIAHAQFETIHPFADGNGRVGRALIHVVLRRRGLAPRYVPPVSLVLAADAKAYVAGLTAFRADRAADWVLIASSELELATFALARRRVSLLSTFRVPSTQGGSAPRRS